LQEEKVHSENPQSKMMGKCHNKQGSWSQSAKSCRIST